MKAQTLVVEERVKTGKQAAGQMRREGKLPGIVYGKKIGNVPVAIPVKDFLSIINKEGENAILNVKIKGGNSDKEFVAVIREVQRQPLNRKVQHIDLYQISLEDTLRSTVPVILEGEAEGVKLGGVLQQNLREVNVEGLPADLPDSITIDVTRLGMGENITVADIEAPPSVKILSDPNTVIASVVAVRVKEAELPPEEEQPIMEEPVTEAEKEEETE